MASGSQTYPWSILTTASITPGSARIARSAVAEKIPCIMQPGSVIPSVTFTIAAPGVPLTETSSTRPIDTRPAGAPTALLQGSTIPSSTVRVASAVARSGSASLAQPLTPDLPRSRALSRLVTISQIEGRVRGVGSEFVLATVMRFAARESAIFSQFEPAFGVLPGSGATQPLARLMGRSHTLEVMLSAEDYDAELANGTAGSIEPCPRTSSPISSSRSHIASPRSRPPARLVVKDRVNAIALAAADDFRRDSDLFAQAVREPEAQGLLGAALRSGLQNREAEMDLASMLGDLARADRSSTTQQAPTPKESA
jgi:enoyl-CoA hydratase/carnithine racemase